MFACPYSNHAYGHMFMEKILTFMKAQKLSYVFINHVCTNVSTIAFNA